MRVRLTPGSHFLSQDMSVILFNSFWMLWNLFLGFIAVIFSYLAIKITSRPLRYLFFLIALLFAPNTIYIVTDLTYLFEDISKVEGFFTSVLITQYLIFVSLGISMFLLVIRDFENLYKSFFSKGRQNVLSFVIVLTIFIVSFGVVIGRVQRANSWHVFTKPLTVFRNAINTLTSGELIGYVLVFGFFANLIYFGFRQRFGVGERT